MADEVGWKTTKWIYGYVRLWSFDCSRKFKI